MIEAGFPDFVVDGWYGMFAPARTPKPIVDKLSADINKALKDPSRSRSGRRWASIRSVPRRPSSPRS